MIEVPFWALLCIWTMLSVFTTYGAWSLASAIKYREGWSDGSFHMYQQLMAASAEHINSLTSTGPPKTKE